MYVVLGLENYFGICSIHPPRLKALPLLEPTPPPPIGEEHSPSSAESEQKPCYT